MSMYDIDSWIDDFETFIKANLNTYITQVNTEKSDSLLKTIDSNAYFFQTMNDRVANYDPFIFYGISDLESIGIGPQLSEKYMIDLIVVLTDTGQDLLTGKKLLRYNRALKEMIKKSWDIIGKGMKLKISSLVPVAFKLANSSNEYRAIGITIEVNLG